MLAGFKKVIIDRNKRIITTIYSLGNIMPLRQKGVAFAEVSSVVVTKGSEKGYPVQLKADTLLDVAAPDKQLEARQMAESLAAFLDRGVEDNTAHESRN
ncbi:MAG: hypothetical protein O7G88_14995 [bacterium]|nr:hypothetical protein [bacterium]